MSDLVKGRSSLIQFHLIRRPRSDNLEQPLLLCLFSPAHFFLSLLSVREKHATSPRPRAHGDARMFFHVTSVR